MNVRVGACRLALLLLWPLAGVAGEVDIPELGVRVTNLPDSASQPVVAARGNGYEATTRVGSAVLSVFRDNDAAPAGSDVAEPSYRAILDAKFADSVKSKAQGAPTAVDGHPGWTVVDAREAGSLTAYTCVTYLLVDQHLYRLEVSSAPATARPPEFDSLVKAMSGIHFEQVRRANAG